MSTKKAQELTPGMIIDISPIFSFFDAHGIEYSESEITLAEVEGFEVENIVKESPLNVVLYSTMGGNYSVPIDFEFEVIGEAEID